MKCIVVDDERPALELLVGELQKFSDVTIVGQFVDGAPFLDALPSLQPDAIFLDIHMPTMSGLQLITAIREKCTEGKIVFVTAHSQYAVDAFEKEVFDYVVKPVYQDRLQKTIDRLRRDYKVETPTIRCFGKLEIRNGDLTVQWQTSKAEEMFAYLLVHENVSIEQVQEHIFPEFSPEKSKAYIYTCVYMIRNSLQKAGLSEKIRLHSSRRFYRVLIAGVENEWTNLLQKEQPLNLETLQRAFQLLQRPLFYGLESTWVTTERYNAEQKLIQICKDCLLIAPFHEQPNGRIVLDGLHEYIDADDQYWMQLLRKLVAEQENRLALELREKLYAAIVEQVSVASAEEWLEKTYSIPSLLRSTAPSTRPSG